MPENLRHFQAVDPFGQTWDVEFRWLQNAISIRHADAIDLKYYISNGEERREIVIALPHLAMLELAQQQNRELTDSWCLHLAGMHLEQIIRSWEDMDRTIVTVSPHALNLHNSQLESKAAALAARSALEH